MHPQLRKIDQSINCLATPPPLPMSSLPEDFKEQDRSLPIANVARIMKLAVPENAKISKEAKQLTQICASEFIAFVTSEYPFVHLY